jgi:hypothetical protein
MCALYILHYPWGSKIYFLQYYRIYRLPSFELTCLELYKVKLITWLTVSVLAHTLKKHIFIKDKENLIHS